MFIVCYLLTSILHRNTLCQAICAINVINQCKYWRARSLFPAIAMQARPLSASMASRRRCATLSGLLESMKASKKSSCPQITRITQIKERGVLGTRVNLWDNCFFGLLFRRLLSRISLSRVSLRLEWQERPIFGRLFTVFQGWQGLISPGKNSPFTTCQAAPSPLPDMSHPHQTR